MAENGQEGSLQLTLTDNVRHYCSLDSSVDERLTGRDMRFYKRY